MPFARYSSLSPVVVIMTAQTIRLRVRQYRFLSLSFMSRNAINKIVIIITRMRTGNYRSPGLVLPAEEFSSEHLLGGGTAILHIHIARV